MTADRSPWWPATSRSSRVSHCLNSLSSFLFSSSLSWPVSVSCRVRMTDMRRPEASDLAILPPTLCNQGRFTQDTGLANTGLSCKYTCLEFYNHLRNLVKYIFNDSSLNCAGKTANSS